jgi:hypothetical protein
MNSWRDDSLSLSLSLSLPLRDCSELQRLNRGASPIVLLTRVHLSCIQIVDQLIARFNDPHPRVRWAAINAMGQLETDLGPELQDNFHAKVLLLPDLHFLLSAASKQQAGDQRASRQPFTAT